MSPLRFAIVALLVSLGATASASVQTCHTRCQSQQTDCYLRCDGHIPCIQGCQADADRCADACLQE